VRAVSLLNQTGVTPLDRSSDSPAAHLMLKGAREGEIAVPDGNW
jgi:hypothetical protein